MPVANDELLLFSLILTLASGGAALPIVILFFIPTIIEGIIESISKSMKMGGAAITGVFIFKKLGDIVKRIVNNGKYKNPFSNISGDTYSKIINK